MDWRSQSDLGDIVSHLSSRIHIVDVRKVDDASVAGGSRLRRRVTDDLAPSNVNILVDGNMSDSVRHRRRSNSLGAKHTRGSHWDDFLLFRCVDKGTLVVSRGEFLEKSDSGILLAVYIK